jgi:WD40 repeat protein
MHVHCAPNTTTSHQVHHNKLVTNTLHASAIVIVVRIPTGTSEGNVARIYFDGNKTAEVEQVIRSEHDCVVAISCASDSVLSAHDDGAAVLWDSEDTKPRYQFNGPDSCTAASLRANFVVVAYANGSVRVWRRSTRILEHEIFAHARCVMGLAMHPSMNMFATVGLDTCVNVWKIPDSANAGEGEAAAMMSVVHSESVEDAMLTGVQFARDGSADLAVSSYDRNSLVIWRG